MSTETTYNRWSPTKTKDQFTDADADAARKYPVVAWCMALKLSGWTHVVPPVGMGGDMAGGGDYWLDPEGVPMTPPWTEHLESLEVISLETGRCFYKWEGKTIPTRTKDKKFACMDYAVDFAKRTLGIYGWDIQGAQQAAAHFENGPQLPVAVVCPFNRGVKLKWDPYFERRRPKMLGM